MKDYRKHLQELKQGYPVPKTPRKKGQLAGGDAGADKNQGLNADMEHADAESPASPV